MTAAPFRRPLRVGVAIAEDRVVATLGGPGVRSWTVAATDAPSRAEGIASALELVIETVRRSVAPSVRPLALDVALLPPLVECRRVELPGLQEDEARRVLARDLDRYFPAGAAARVVGLTRSRDRRTRLAAAAPVDLVDAIHAAASRVGCTVERIVPAQCAWAAGAAEWADDSGAPPAVMAVFLGARVELLRIEGGRLTALRRLPTAMLDDGHLADRIVGLAAEPSANGAGGGVAMVGQPPRSVALAEALSARGVRVASPRSGEPVSDPAVLAAACSMLAREGPELLPDAMRGERLRRDAQRARGAWAAAVVLLMLAGALELWGTRRELARLAEARAALRGELTGVLATRDTLTLLTERLAALRAAEAGTPRWSEALAAVAANLPRDASLVSLGVEGDSLVLEGIATRAAPVFEALAAAPGVLAVRAQGSIRQEIRAGARPVERFTLSVRLAAARPASDRGASP